MRQLEQKYFSDVDDVYGTMRSRFLFLIPLNLVLCYGAMKSPRYINQFTRKYILRGRQPSFRTILPVSLLQSIAITSAIVGLNCAVLGFNPFTMVNRLNDSWEELE